MATSGITLRKYQRLIRSLFPRGIAWQLIYEKDSNIRKLLDALGNEPCRIEEAGFGFTEDVFPDTTTDLLTDWERLLNLPDECEEFPELLTIDDRRTRIIQVLSTLGGQNATFYKELVASFGVDINTVDVEDQLPFTAGRSRAGDRITNGDWRYAFIVTAPATVFEVFKAGSRCGKRLQDASNSTIECLIRKHKPAHTIAIFAFTI